MKNIRAYFWVVFLVYFGTVSIFLWQWKWQLFWWWLGGLIGLSLIWIDRAVYVYVTKPQEQLSVYCRHLLKERRYKEMIQVLKQRGGEQQHLVTTSFLFMAVWVAMAVYVITSSGSLLASGLILGAGLRSVWQIVTQWRDKEGLKRQLFWQIKRTVSDREVTVILGLYVGVFILLSVAMV